MPKWLKIVIAIVACAVVIIGYSVLSTMLGFKHGGGYIVIILLFSLLGGIWRAIVGSNKEKKTEGAIEDGNGILEPAAGQEERVRDDEVSPGTKYSVLNANNYGPSAKQDYHIVLKVLLLIMMVVGVITMIYQVVNDFTWENYTIGWVRLISSIIGLGGFVLLYMKKLSGYIIIVAVLLFSVVYSAIMHDSNLGMILLAAAFRLVAISLFLLIRKEGISAWSILLGRHMDTISELKETFPVKPFLYIEKSPDNAPKASSESTNSFDNWLNS